MDVKNKSYEVARKLVELYLSIDESKRTPEETTIIEDMISCAYSDDGRRDGRTDYFYKRINNIYKTFMLDQYIIDKKQNIIMPRPVFDIFNYDDDSLIHLLKVLIENDIRVGNRKSKYNSYKKIDVDKNNSNIIDIVNKISDKEYKSFEYIESNYYLYNLENLWKEIRSNVKQELKKELEKTKEVFNKKKINEYKIILYKKLLEQYFYDIIIDFENGQYFKHIKLNNNDDNILYIIKYKIVWNLFIKIVNTVFQYISVVFKIKDEDSIINELNILVEETEKNKKIYQHEENISDGYYKYCYMIETSLIQGGSNSPMLCIV